MPRRIKTIKKEVDFIYKKWINYCELCDEGKILQRNTKLERWQIGVSDFFDAIKPIYWELLNHPEGDELLHSIKQIFDGLAKKSQATT